MYGGNSSSLKSRIRETSSIWTCGKRRVVQTLNQEVSPLIEEFHGKKTDLRNSEPEIFKMHKLLAASQFFETAVASWSATASRIHHLRETFFFHYLTLLPKSPNTKENQLVVSNIGIPGFDHFSPMNFVGMVLVSPLHHRFSLPDGSASPQHGVRRAQDLTALVKNPAWRFPEIGVPLNHPFWYRFFHEKGFGKASWTKNDVLEMAFCHDTPTIADRWFPRGTPSHHPF